jgi:hypothetical protein
LQSASDFIQDAQPIVRDLMMKAITTGETLWRDGYTDAASAGVRVAEAMVRAHSADDWRQVERSVPQLIGFLRELTKPEVLQALEAIIHGFGQVQAMMNVNKPTLTLVRDLNSTEARRGMAVLVEFPSGIKSDSRTLSYSNSRSYRHNLRQIHMKTHRV